MMNVDRAEAALRDWLTNPLNVVLENPAAAPRAGFFSFTLRDYLVTADGARWSVQQSAAHYCGPDSVEVWHCPLDPLLAPYGDGTEPYAYVPIPVLAQVIAKHGGIRRSEPFRVRGANANRRTQWNTK
jgi:hypothetical protein